MSVEKKQKVSVLKFAKTNAKGEEIDSISVINDEYLWKTYPDFHFLKVFAGVDDFLINTTREVVEIITKTGYINRDFVDIKKILSDNAIAVVSFGTGESNERISMAIENAISFQLLPQDLFYKATKALLVVYSNEQNQITMGEIDFIRTFFDKLKNVSDPLWGAYIDETLGASVKVVILASIVLDKNENQEKNYAENSRTPFMITVKLEEMESDQAIKLLEETTSFNKEKNRPTITIINS